ncbi:aldose 1-epimerase [Alicyclobacillus tolerans]|uniref:Aldose 1-epimerase n=1 Tax=Alicyclobacillus tolerans TaxID=90970 RepID=A0ABT9LYZ5_9BACL|nr:aldose 1-epimerase [Alicyclobacillus tengchongensis]MDP9729507.1 aldose 1-epimerase [Alicyclobacillus tengchongensis]
MREAKETTFRGERAVVLRWENLQATVLPEIGANLISFRDLIRGFTLLHEPGVNEMDDFRRTPYLYGIPVLFPPNRYDAGTFTYAGTHVQLPVNEAATGAHLHGVLYDTAWEVKDFGSTQVESYVVLSVKVDEAHPLFAKWPFCFTFELRYGLNEFGLSQYVLVRNDGGGSMPCLVGFHTAVNAPFAEHGDATDYRCRFTIGERWELDDRGLPTGVRLPLTSYEQALRDVGAYPFVESMDNHYTALAQDGYNRMELWDMKRDVTLVYDVGLGFGQWMVWNHYGQPGFFCAEPQVNVVNAPNLELPADEVGLFPVRPGEVWEAHSRLYVRDGGVKQD